MPIKIDEDNLKKGLLGLVVTLVEIIEEVLEREAMRRMESGRLNEKEIDRLGRALMELNEAIEHIKEDNDIKDTVHSLRADLDDVVEEAFDVLINPERWEKEGVRI